MGLSVEEEYDHEVQIIERRKFIMEVAQPLRDLVIVKPIPIEEIIISEIYYGENIVRDRIYGAVVAIGPKVQDIEIFDIVLFPFQQGELILVNNEKFIILKQSEIWGVMYGNTEEERAV